MPDSPPAPIGPDRPRDELGRPLPAGEPDRLGLPDFDALDIDACHALAIELLEAGNAFGAHEAWETCWRLAKGGADEEFFKGLAQLGAGLTHHARGNPHGVRVLLGRALDRIGTRGSPHRGIDVAAFAHDLRRIQAVAAAVERAGSRELPPLAPLRVPRG